jgi:UPF0755 protein
VSKLRKLFILLLMAILGAGGWLGWALLRPTAPAGQQFVMLKPGWSTRRIAVTLKAAGVIRSQDAFLIWHYIRRKQSLKAGEYLFEKPATIVDVHNRLVRGDIYVHTVVIPEGYTMFDVAQAVEAAGLGKREEFMAVALDTSLIHDLAPEAKTLEGYLFPDTYEFTRTQSMHDIAAAMVKHFREVASSLGLSADVQDTVIMASIVEKETAAPEERPVVAGVYYNRLAKRMALDADPSVIYGELLTGAYQGSLHHADLVMDSAYNTYKHSGLPPGPIANPGKSALEAAMHPAKTDYLYFVSNGNGHHRFARSLEEHNKNINAYRRAMRQQ